MEDKEKKNGEEQHPQPEPETKLESTSKNENESVDKQNFVIELDSFNGPLDLLLHLIRDHKLDIFDIPIVQITESYLAYLEIMQMENIDVAGEYLLMAATLIQIKSRTLLPDPEPEEDEDGELIDPREELVSRLLEYQKYKDAAERLADYPRMDRDFFARETDQRQRSRASDTEMDLDESSLLTLTELFHDLLEHLHKSKPYEVEMGSFSLENKVLDVHRDLIGKKRFSFKNLFSSQPSRFDLVATFLSVLELARMKVLRLFQAGTGGDIYIDYREDAPPTEEIEKQLKGAASHKEEEDQTDTENPEAESEDNQGTGETEQ